MGVQAEGRALHGNRGQISDSASPAKTLYAASNVLLLILIRDNIVSGVYAKQLFCLHIFSTKMRRVIEFRACLFAPGGQTTAFSAVPAM